MNSQLETSFSKVMEKMSGWLDTLLLQLPNIVIALVIFAGAFYLSRRVRKYANKLLMGKLPQVSMRNLAANVISILVLSMGIVLCLSVLNLDQALTSLLAGAGVAGLAIGLALQDTLSNTFSGIFLSVKSIMNVGDFVITNGYLGTVEEITLRYIKLKEPDNNIVIIPNKMVVENPFKNYGLTPQMRVTIECGVGYGSNLKQVKKLAIQAIEEAFPQPAGKDVEFHYKAFGGSSIDFQVRFWLDAIGKKTVLEAKSDAIIAVKECFDQNNINIPFPIRTLQFDNDLKMEPSKEMIEAFETA